MRHDYSSCVFVIPELKQHGTSYKRLDPEMFQGKEADQKCLNRAEFLREFIKNRPEKAKELLNLPDYYTIEAIKQITVHPMKLGSIIDHEEY